MYNVHCTYNMLSITFTPDLGQDLFHPADNLVLSLSPQSPLTSLKLIKTLNVSLNFPLAPNWGQSSIIPFTPSLTSTLTELGHDFSLLLLRPPTLLNFLQHVFTLNLPPTPTGVNNPPCLNGSKCYNVWTRDHKPAVDKLLVALTGFHRNP